MLTHRPARNSTLRKRRRAGHRHINELARQVEALKPADALRRDTAEGRRVAAAKIETAVEEAINQGKVMASRRKH